jgi:ABC-type sulfate transport system permease component
MFRFHRLTDSLRAWRAVVTGRAHEAGQATAEYALVVLAAAAVAALVIAWASSTGRISRLLNAVIDAVISRVS